MGERNGVGTAEEAGAGANRIGARGEELPLPEPRGEELPLPEPRGEELPLPEPRGEELPLPEPRGEELPLPEPRGEELPLPEPRGEELPLPEPRGEELPLPEPRGEELPLPEPRGEELPLPEPRGEELPLPEPRGEELPLPEPRGEELPLPEPRGEELPLPEPRGEELPLPEPRREEPPLPEPRGEEVKSRPPPQPRPPPLQSSSALLRPVPQPLLLDTLPVFLDLPVLDLEPRSLQHWPQLCPWFPAPLSPSTQMSLGCCQTSLLLPLFAASLPLGDRTSLHRFPGEDLGPLRHPPVPRPTLRSALSARWGPMSPVRGPFLAAPEGPTHPQARPCKRAAMDIAGLEAGYPLHLVAIVKLVPGETCADSSDVFLFAAGRGRQPIYIRLSVMAVTRRGLPIENITGAEALVESCGDGEPQKKKRETEQSISSSRGETLGSPTEDSQTSYLRGLSLRSWEAAGITCSVVLKREVLKAGKKSRRIRLEERFACAALADDCK
ncbi:UNVERIFIED_CONTAM: hypothetical protein FKN15_071805 [Acipenser sinensis]